MDKLKPEAAQKQPPKADAKVEILTEISLPDMHDLCDAAFLAIENGGGFGWLRRPERDTMEKFWRGVITMPLRHLLVARLDGTICGAAQIVMPPPNNEAQAHAVHLISVFLAPWARGYGLARKLIERAEEKAKQDGFKVINLDVRETQQAAINLYESLGYQQCGLHPHYAEDEGKPVKGYYYYKTL